MDPILKERLFGVSGPEGNHGEDVKEYYYYLDSTPTHSYMKALYKYPQSPFPYSDLVDTNRRRPRYESEYELIDTGIFDENRYFDIFIEYAKNDVDDILVRATVINRGPDRRRPCICCLRSGSAIPGAGAMGRRGRSYRASTAIPSASTSSRWATSSCGWKTPRRCCSPKTKATRMRLWGYRQRATL